MTMFKKVFGSQMAEEEKLAPVVLTPEDMMPEEAPRLDVEPEPDPEPQAERRPVRSSPLFAPVPNVLTHREQEEAQRRAEKQAELKERAAKQAAAVAPAPSSPPPARPPAPTPNATAAPPDPVPAPPAAPIPRPAGRARTRLLGFDHDAEAIADPMAGPAAKPAARRYPTGWIVVVEGPGQGHFFPLFNGVSSIGRDEEQAIALCFGDMTISRENHAAIAYDAEENKFYVGHGGKSNIIRLNGKPVLSTEELSHNDTLRIGETKLRFAAFCGADFDWAAQRSD